MAKHVIETLLDDLDETSEAAETVYFALGNRGYEIDLNDQHIDELHEALAPYIDAARKAGSNGGHSHRPTKPEKDGISREEATAIRAWVRDNGGTIGDRGRIPKRVLDAYDSVPKDTSIFTKDDDEQPEQAQADDQLVSAGAGGGFSTFTDQGGQY